MARELFELVAFVFSRISRRSGGAFMIRSANRGLINEVLSVQLSESPSQFVRRMVAVLSKLQAAAILKESDGLIYILNVTCRSLLREPPPVFMASASTSSSRPVVSPKGIKVNDSLYEFYRPAEGDPEVDIVFCHGLQLGSYKEAYHTTWMSADGSQCWLNTWLPEKIPRARILSISYDSSAMQTTEYGWMDRFLTGENLITDVIDLGQVGRQCPVVLIGHCLGGLIMKELCIRAHRIKSISEDSSEIANMLSKFLTNVKGVFFFATPHHGSRFSGEGSMFGKLMAIFLNGPLMKDLGLLNKEISRMNEEFSKLRSKREYRWKAVGVGESKRTTVLGYSGFFLVEEGSARSDMDKFYTLGSDHFSICKPRDTTCSGFQMVVQFVNEMKNQVEMTRTLEVVQPLHQLHGVPKYGVGLRERAQEVQKMLREATVLGIVGMGGIGKTAIAREVFNNIVKEYEYTCFVDNVKETSDLEHQVLSLFYHNGNRMDGVHMQWSHLNNKKTLIVMDDVDLEGQLEFLPKSEFLGSGSHLIITTRNQIILGRFDHPCVVYEVTFLTENEAKKLFCRHAFKEEAIPGSFLGNQKLIQYVEVVTNKCGGLPLTLEVIGSYLHRKGNNLDIWEETIGKLGRAEKIGGGENDRVWVKLMVSFDALDHKEQEMFVDATSFFFEKPLELALAAWSTAYGSAKSRWADLVSRCLVKEVWKTKTSYGPSIDAYETREEFGEVWVHEHLRDLGKNVAQNKKFKNVEPSKVVSLHQCANITMKLLNANMVDAKTRFLELEERDDKEMLKFGSLARLKGLKYIKLESILHEGTGRNLLSTFWPSKWIKFSQDNLWKELSLLIWSNQNGYQRAKFPMSLEGMDKLAVLLLDRWSVTKGFIKALEKLINLQILSLQNMARLDHLPRNFGALSHLERLTLCSLQMSTLPESFGNLLSLKYLSFRNVSLVGLPESFGNLSSLEDLQFEKVSLVGLPEAFGNLATLISLKFSDCEILASLPESLGNLSSLTTLIFEWCESLVSLPESFGLLHSLEELVLNYVPLTTLPDNFGELIALRRMNLVVFYDSDIPRTNRLQSLPSNCFCRLTSLRTLELRAEDLLSVSKSLGDLVALEELELDVQGGWSVPESIGHLPSLRDLAIQCHAVYDGEEETVVDTTSQEAHVELSQRRLRALGNISSLESLTLLHFHHLESLPDELGYLSSLRKLTLWGFSHLESLPVELGNLSSLRELNLGSFPHLESLPDEFGNLSSLRELTLDGFPHLECLPDSVGGLSSLRKVKLFSCWRLKCLPDNLGRPFSPESSSSQEGRASEESSSASTTAVGEMDLELFDCPLLDDSKTESLGWVKMRKLRKPDRRRNERMYRRKGPIEESIIVN